MTAPILKALSNGFSHKQILDYVLKKFPDHKEKIQKALAAGFTAEQVIKYLSSGMKGLTKEPEQSEINTEHAQTRSRDIQKRENVNQGAMAAAGLGLSSLAAPMASAALQRALPPSLVPPGSGTQKLRQAIQASTASPSQGQSQTSLTPSLPQQSNQLPSPNDQGISPTSQPLVNQVAPTIPQAPQAVQPEGISNPKEYLEKLGIKDRVDQLLKAGNTPQGVAAALGMKRSGETKIDPELLKNIEAYAQAAPQQPQVSAPVEPVSQKLDATAAPIEGVEANVNPLDIAQPEETKPVAKTDTVITPQGVGQVLEVRGNKALIEIDGKKHQVNLDEVEAEPQEVKESQLGFDPSTVPEDLRSAPLNEVYLPHDKRHVTVKYNAGLKPIRYLYFRKDGQQISNEYINKIVQGLQLPISSGSSFFGSWNAEESDSRGAANYEELVKNSQEEGEKDNPSKEYWFIKEEALYEHPYMEKAGKEELRRMEKEFNEAKKKRKKKPA